MIWKQSSETEYRMNHYLMNPEKLDSQERILQYDEYANRIIEEATEMIKAASEYRKELYKRFQEVNAANYKLKLTIYREYRYYLKKAFYHVTIQKIYCTPGIAPADVLRERYEGKQRREAIKRFETLKKKYPNIETEIDIEKAKWER